MGAPPSNQYRIEVLEKGLGELRSTIVDQISTAVNGATTDLQQALIDRLSKSLELSVQRIDDRVTKSKELQDALLNQLRWEQRQFQDEIRHTIFGGKPPGADDEAEIVGHSRVFQGGESERNSGPQIHGSGRGFPEVGVSHLGVVTVLMAVWVCPRATGV